MSKKLHESPHQLGVTFATLVVLVGMAVLITDMLGGAPPRNVAAVGSYTAGLAALCYVVVRLVGWAFAEALITTREHKSHKP